MNLWDVWGLQKQNNLDYGSGDYRALALLPNGSPMQVKNVTNAAWVRIANNVSYDEAVAIMDQYPTASRAKC